MASLVTLVMLLSNFVTVPGRCFYFVCFVVLLPVLLLFLIRLYWLCTPEPNPMTKARSLRRCQDVFQPLFVCVCLCVCVCLLVSFFYSFWIFCFFVRSLKLVSGKFSLEFLALLVHCFVNQTLCWPCQCFLVCCEQYIHLLPLMGLLSPLVDPDGSTFNSFIPF